MSIDTAGYHPSYSSETARPPHYLQLETKYPFAPHALNTPLKRFHTYHSIEARRLVTKHAEKMGAEDIEENGGVTETHDFLRHFFNIPEETVKKVLETLKEAGYYKEGSWYGQIDNKKGLMSICEAIRKAHNSGEHDDYACRWIASPHQTPTSKANPPTSSIRPDAFLLLGMEGGTAKWEEEFAKLESDHEGLVEKVTAFWLRIGVVMEFRCADCDDSNDILDHIAPLVRHLRQMLQEQLDRWFVPGLLFSEKELAVWIVDRSGIIGMDKSFDIHEVSPTNLTTSKTVQALNSESGEVRTSHSGMFDALTRTSGLGSNDEIMIYVLKQCWRPAESRPEGEMYPPAEEAMKNHVGRLYTWEDVHVGSTRVDTAPFIRGQFTTLHRFSTGEATDPEAERRSAFLEEHDLYAFMADTYYFTLPPTFIVEPRILTRTLLKDSFGWSIQCFKDLPELIRVCNHVVKALEWLYFEKKTLQCDITTENVLITAIRGTETQGCLVDFDHAMVIEDTKFAMLAEVEENNVQVDPRLAAWTALEKGHLPLVAYRALTWAIAEGRLHSISYYVKDFQELIGRKEEHEVPVKIEDIGLFTVSEVGFSIFSLNGPNILRWTIAHSDARCKEIPTRQRKSIRCYHFLQFTLNFSSPEVLTASRLEGRCREDEKRLAHDARHDLEALFWVMTYICITRGGPGGQRRDELDPESNARNFRLREQIQSAEFGLFSSDDFSEITKNKRNVFVWKRYESGIMPCFHPYFNGLKPLMAAWFRILLMAHRYPIFETVHKTLRKELDSCYANLLTSGDFDTPNEEVEAIVQMRDQELRYLRGAGLPADAELQTQSSQSTDSQVPERKHARANSTLGLVDLQPVSEPTPNAEAQRPVASNVTDMLEPPAKKAKLQ
ncbi:hypothetical protein H0H92_015929 [Tricholoma furcatifolium]|nr:hypothetical protein H0H92_015929 [Tricholoma furcatifolium]